LALHHVPLLIPALYNMLDYEPLSAPQLERLLLAFFVLPEVAARAMRRLYAATARIEAGALVIEQGGHRSAVPLPDISGVKPWSLPLPWPGFRLETRSADHRVPGLAAADPASLISALATAGDGAEGRCALRHPAVRYASARQRARGALDHPLVKYVLYPLVPAVVLFRMRQLIAYGGILGEYHEFGLTAYLLGFGIYWLLSAIYLLLFAALLRAIGEAIALGAVWTLGGWDLGVRRVVEILHRLVYFLGPPTLMFVRLVLLQ
jgi:apolipoprotein N-acyltransferase